MHIESSDTVLKNSIRLSDGIERPTCGKIRQINATIAYDSISSFVSSIIFQRKYTVLIVIYFLVYGRGGIVVRAHAFRAEGLRFESDSMP